MKLKRSMSLARALKEFKRLHGWKQGAMADYIGVSLRTYRNWEYGINQPTGLAMSTVLEKLNGKTKAVKRERRGE